jgi:amino acid transporter
VRSLLSRLVGKPRDLRDPNLFHTVSLIAFFAWVGLGADGLSSSAYGPDEAYKNLAGHTYLAVFLAISLALTVFIISYGYSRIIERFPTGGGGYVVASKLLGEKAGLVSGCALLVDYVLTITTSIAGGANAVFAFLPHSMQQFKFGSEIAFILLLLVLNLRGVKESVQVLTPIFITFVVTHVFLILGSVFLNLGHVQKIASDVQSGLSHDVKNLGFIAIGGIFFRAYALGGSSYTGIEAVSNGLAIMREPHVVTGKRTMVLMATSLAAIAGGILLAYLLVDVTPVKDVPTNAVLAQKFSAGWGSPGKAFFVVTMLSEGALLVVAAQTGFIDGPRVMANMALDSWFPHQFAALSERLTMRNGVYLMSAAALLTLVYTRGDIDVLTVMYSINVFVTFSLSNLGMSRLWVGLRKEDPTWRRKLAVHLVALLLCMSVLVIMVVQKFRAGGWVTLVVTTVAIAICYAIKRHYRDVAAKVRRLDAELRPQIEGLADSGARAEGELDPEEPTAVLLVGGYGGLGISTLMQIDRTFPKQYRQVVFLSVGVIDSGSFKGASELAALKESVQGGLVKYEEFARTKMGWTSESDMIVGTEVVAELERLCREVHLRFPRSVFFAGKLIFAEPTWWERLLHNETAHALQRRLEFDRLPMVILPVRVL